MKLFVVRHGQTTANVTRIYSGQSDVMLTEEGIAQAKALQPLLSRYRFDRVYSSDLSRAIDTQRLALPGVEGERTALIREIDVGRAAGYPWGQVPGAPEGWSSERDPDPYVKVGGESYAQMDARVKKFMDQLVENPCERAIAFVHNGAIGSMMRIILGANVSKGALFSENCAVHVLEYDGKKWRLLAWNYMKGL